MTVVWYQACIVSAVFDRHVLALDIARVLQALAEIPQSVAERFRRLAVKDTDDRHRHYNCRDDAVPRTAERCQQRSLATLIRSPRRYEQRESN